MVRESSEIRRDQPMANCAGVHAPRTRPSRGTRIAIAATRGSGPAFDEHSPIRTGLRRPERARHQADGRHPIGLGRAETALAQCAELKLTWRLNTVPVCRRGGSREQRSSISCGVPPFALGCDPVGRMRRPPVCERCHPVWRVPGLLRRGLLAGAMCSRARAGGVRCGRSLAFQDFGEVGRRFGAMARRGPDHEIVGPKSEHPRWGGRTADGGQIAIAAAGETHRSGGCCGETHAFAVEQRRVHRGRMCARPGEVCWPRSARRGRRRGGRVVDHGLRAFDGALRSFASFVLWRRDWFLARRGCSGAAGGGGRAAPLVGWCFLRGEAGWALPRPLPCCRAWPPSGAERRLRDQHAYLSGPPGIIVLVMNPRSGGRLTKFGSMIGRAMGARSRSGWPVHRDVPPRRDAVPRRRPSGLEAGTTHALVGACGRARLRYCHSAGTRNHFSRTSGSIATTGQCLVA